MGSDASMSGFTSGVCGLGPRLIFGSTDMETNGPIGLTVAGEKVLQLCGGHFWD